MHLQNQNQNIDGQPEQPQQTGAIIGQAREILYHCDASEVQIPQQMGRLLIQGSHLMNEHLQYTSSNVISHSNGSVSAILGPHEPVLTQHQYQERLPNQVMLDQSSQNAPEVQKLQQNQSHIFHQSDYSKQSVCNPTNKTITVVSNLCNQRPPHG